MPVDRAEMRLVAVGPDYHNMSCGHVALVLAGIFPDYETAERARWNYCASLFGNTRANRRRAFNAAHIEYLLRQAGWKALTFECETHKQCTFGHLAHCLHDDGFPAGILRSWNHVAYTQNGVLYDTSDTRQRRVVDFWARPRPDIQLGAEQWNL